MSQQTNVHPGRRGAVGLKPRTSGPSGAHVSPRVKVSVDEPRRKAWAKAARVAGKSLATWLRDAGDSFANYREKEK